MSEVVDKSFFHPIYHTLTHTKITDFFYSHPFFVSILVGLKGEIYVKEAVIRTMTKDGIDYICITDIARQKNAVEPKDVVKNWMRQKNTLEYLGLWEKLNNPNFKGVEFNPLLSEAGSNSFTMSPSRWVE